MLNWWLPNSRRVLRLVLKGDTHLVLGTVQLGMSYGINNTTGQPSEAESHKILDEALKQGIRGLDTATSYGNSQSVIGSYGADKFDVYSKFSLAEGDAVSQLNKVLVDLQVPKVKCFSFHVFDEYQSAAGAKAILDLKASKLSEWVGVSVYTLEELQLVVSRGDVNFVQVPLNILDSSRDKLSALAEANLAGIHIQVRSVYLQGLFFKDPEKLPEKLAPFRRPLQDITAVAKAHGQTMESICLMFPFLLENVNSVVVGVESVEQLETNVGIVRSLGELEVPAWFSEVCELDFKHTDLLNPGNW